MDLQSAFPAEFPFYHGSQVRAEPAAAADWVIAPESAAAAISLQGDVRGVLLMIFDQDLDYAMYAEMANILAARLVARLAAEEGQDVVISPPRRLSFEQLCSVVTSDENLVRRDYVHLHQGKLVPVQAVLIQASARSPFDV